MIKVTSCRPEAGARLRLEFSDGTSNVYDCAQFLSRPGSMVQPLKEATYFDRVFLEMGAPTWPNGFDLAPWAIHKELKDAGALTPANASAAE